MDLVDICREEGRKQATDVIPLQGMFDELCLDPYGGMIPLQGMFDELCLDPHKNYV